MPCFRPLTGYRSIKKNSSGKRPIVFNPNEGFRDQPVQLPCGQCIGCRLEKSRIWAVRCVHEASLYENNCFITLTFNNEHLPKDGSLNVRDFQLFMKRLRKRFKNKIRFFHCGEYGEKFKRPHYHACLFNFDFPDKKLWSIRDGNRLYTSETLQELWPFGFATIGDVTFESAAYVARYITKKITGEKAIEHYNTIDFETGEVLKELKPEYTTMSRKPGIGKAWFEKFHTDVYPDDFVVLSNGKKVKPPKYYDSQFEILNPDLYQEIKLRREIKGKRQKENNTGNRLYVREEIQNIKFNQLKRGYENNEN